MPTCRSPRPPVSPPTEYPPDLPICISVTERETTQRRVRLARGAVQPRQEFRVEFSRELAPILLEQLEYLIEFASDEQDRFERVAAILMERFR